MLKLPDVTLCTLGSEKYKTANQKALDVSSRDILFGDIKNIIHPKSNNIDEWNKAMVYDLGDYIETPFALIVHPDGYVVHPECFRPEFLDYDYIGSPFPLPTDSFSFRDVNGKIQRVGNSVSIRSKKLLTLPKKIDMPWKSFHGYSNEDGFICVNMRHVFEEHGCTFAPLEIAKYFGRENDVEENMDIDKTFIFHKAVGRNSCYEDFEEK